MGQSASGLTYAIDVVAIFRDQLWLRGWLFDQRPIRALYLLAPGLEHQRRELASWGNTVSEDVAAVHGDAASRARFDETIAIDEATFNIAKATLMVAYQDGESVTIGDLGTSGAAHTNELVTDFLARISRQPNGELLEIGSRARSSVVRRDMTPPRWHYTGLDVAPGINVDVVGDAHELASLFPELRFNAVMAFSVLEHLLMPWKMVVELNRVLTIGALGLFTTHQCWPLHDEPWDFWRFSDQSWHALLNRATGFEILSAKMGEPAFIVAQRCHPVTNFGLGQSGYLSSSVLFRKTEETLLTWPVKLDHILRTKYPSGRS